MEKIIFLKILKQNNHSNATGSVSASSQFVIHISLLFSLLLLVQSLVLVDGFASDSHGGGILNGHDNNNNYFYRNTKCPVGPIITILNREDSFSNNNNKNKKNGSGSDYSLGASVSKFWAEDDQGKIFSFSYHENTTAVSLSCWASSPIIWNFDGPLGMIIRSTNISRISSEQDVRKNISSNFCYNSVINVAIQRRFTGTGNYSCSLIHQPSTIDSIYLYGNEKSSPSFLRPSGPLTGSIPTNHKRNLLTLPCRVNNPHVTALAYLKKEGQFHRVDSDPVLKEQYKINYRAKSGFEMTGLGSNHIANLDGQQFKCEIVNEFTKSVQDSIILTVVQDQPERKKSDELLIEFKDYGNCASFMCSPQKDSSLLKNGDKLEISFIKCENPMHCKLASTSVYDEIDFSKSNKDDCSDKRDIRPTGVSIQVDLDNDRSGIVLCRTTNKKYFQSLQYFTPPFKDNITILKDETTNNVNPSTTSSSPPLLIDVFNRTFYVNEEIEVSCKASSFLFANGLQWLIQFRNGSIHQATAFSDSIVKKTADTIQVSSKMKMISEDIESVICLAPDWSSSHWTNSTFNVRVIDGTLPSIIEVSEPEIFYKVEDVNKSLSCEATGLPMPIISWYKGGEPYEDKTQNSYPHFDTLTKEHQNITIANLIFHKVAWNSSTIAGRYYCNATNAKGTAIRFITVDVEGSSTWKIWTSFFVAFLVCILVVLTFYLHKFWRKSETQKEYIRKLTAGEIDEFKRGRRQPLPQNGGIRVIGDGREVAQYLPYDFRYEVNEEDLILEEDPVNRKLGEGNYGIVVKGTLVRNGDRIPVAVKTLRSWNTLEAKALLSELKILTYVGQHENVVSLVGAITNIEQGKIQVIIEYCSQRSLDAYLRQKRGVFLNEITDDQISFSPQSVTEGSSSDYVKIVYAIKTIDLIRWSYQFACGMSYLASRKIIHGDLATRNLLLTETRDLKISDFGLSKKLTNYSDNYTPSLEKPNSEQRQPWRSLAPEYWMESAKKFSTQTDAWAFGVTLWEIFSMAEVPYAELDFGISFINLLASGYRLDKPKYANSHIYEIMTKCWDEKPEKRPSFENLANWFKSMLPGNYTSSMPLYRPLEITPMNLDYIYDEDLERLEQFQFQDC